jgi:hypothetical protein
MTIGTSGSYAINGVDFTLQPTNGRWIPSAILGMTGDGHPIYSAIHEFQIQWSLSSQTDLIQIQNFRDMVWLTGTISIDLPAYRGAEYEFTTYSGCSLYEPDRGLYFVDHTNNFQLIVGNIRIL